MTVASVRRSSPGGFTLIEVIVAIVLLTIVGTAIGGAAQFTARTLRKSNLELEAAGFLETEVERLRMIAYDSVANGTRTIGRGTATWQVVDSTTFRRILLSTRVGTPASGLVVDSVTLFRVR